MDKEDYEKAKEKVQQQEKQQLIDDFEKAGKTKTDYSIEERNRNHLDFFYGVPVMEDGKLKGFNMMTFSKSYDDGMSFCSDDKALLDENGKPVFMTVDEYYKFYKEREIWCLGFLSSKSKEQNEIENTMLSNSKLAKIRNKLAKKIDNALGTDLEKKKIAKPLKKIEKAVSDKLLGKVKD